MLTNLVCPHFLCFGQYILRAQTYFIKNIQQTNFQTDIFFEDFLLFGFVVDKMESLATQISP